MYHVVLASKVIKFLGKGLDEKTKNKIATKIDQLAIDPFAPNTNLTKMKEVEHGYRLRVGDIRIVYEVDTQKKIIIIWKIDHRSSVYSN